MSPSAIANLSLNRRLMAYTAAAMYGGATLDAAVEGALPGDPAFDVAPAIVAAAVVVLVLVFGPRMPRRVLAGLGPLGVLLIAIALATTPGAGDGAVLYMWPVLWSTFFFGRRGAIGIVACIAVAHTITLLVLPAASSYPGRWVDVIVSVSVVAAVVLTLVHRNDLLLARLAEEARTDALTGLLNRRGFEERAVAELARCRRDVSTIAMAAFDIDYFKRVNDEWGHETGDRVLARTARLLAAHARAIDVVARFGGEEFVVLLPGLGEHDVAAFAERVRSALGAPDPDGLPTVKLSAGVVAAVAPDDIDTLLQRADSALYKAKRSGRDRTVAIPADAPGDLQEPLRARFLPARA
jgi:diguanylate cyclase (GGDEF)-like protein